MTPQDEGKYKCMAMDEKEEVRNIFFIFFHKKLTTVSPRIVRIKTVRFHYSAINFLVLKYSIL